MTGLKNSRVFFDDISHTYILDGKQLLGVTSLMKKHGLSTDYSGVPSVFLQKAASRGTAIHEAISEYIKTGRFTPNPLDPDGLNEERVRAVNEYKKTGLNAIESEFLISDEKLVASSIDIIIEDYSLVDIKTTNVLDKHQLAWQLSIYKYLFEKQVGITVPSLYGLHIKRNGHNLVPITPILKCEVERLFECERNGVLYTPLDLAESEAHLKELFSLEMAIANIEDAVASAKARRDEFRERLYNLMEEKSILKLENENMKITRIFPTTRKGVDSKMLSENYPDIYQKVIKETNVKGSIKITLK
jgi:regulator of replication initiation timing